MITIWRVGEGSGREGGAIFSNLHFKQRSMGRGDMAGLLVPVPVADGNEAGKGHERIGT